MVWIHGGARIAGETNDYNASKLVTQGDVIVVTFNYRLGPLDSSLNRQSTPSIGREIG